MYGGEVANHAKQAYFYGYAHENVRRVTLRLGGEQYGAQTFAAWPGSGLRLWAFPVPASTLLSPTPAASWWGMTRPAGWSGRRTS